MYSNYKNIQTRSLNVKNIKFSKALFFRGASSLPESLNGFATGHKYTSLNIHRQFIRHNLFLYSKFKSFKGEMSSIVFYNKNM